ncbi:hypothetical protein HRI_003605000 [Hibiscus trionum]|uniref:F-box domain-containing protein n=1 Tax=Hibiscus trionum TaxID=183268 RepID=A0A9W7IMM3_HIBTR|nr:hypothetical protein HRI_003605000 [Hibiscus trionum]
MGQSPSAALPRETSLTFLSSSVFLSSEKFLDEIVANQNYTAEIPDECLAYVFQFFGPGDRTVFLCLQAVVSRRQLEPPPPVSQRPI